MRALAPIHVLVLVCLALAAPAGAQTNLRAWPADGQVWLVWEDDQTFTSNECYEIYQSNAPIADVSTAVRIGRLLPPDWQSPRTRAAQAGATWTIPDGLGGQYTLAANEAVFASTPHAAASRHYAIVKSGNTLPPAGATAGPIATVLGTVVPHAQLSGVDEGHPYTVYALWIDGRPDETSGVPGFPVMGNEHFNGTAHVFAVFESPTAPPPGPLPTVAFLHGGDGSFWGSRPSRSDDTRIDLGVDDGLYVTLDDSFWMYGPPPVDAPVRTPSRWFGVSEVFDRFEDPTPPPPDDTRVLDYTQRRIDWVLDWLVTAYDADPLRTAVAGLSMGGRGTWLYARTRPERVSACLAFVQPMLHGNNSLGALYGLESQNLATNLGVGYADLLDASTLPLGADVPFARFVDGTEDAQAIWAPKPAVYAALEAARVGVHVYWDDREHVGGNGGWDGAHWVGSPRHSMQALTRYASDVSFPALSGFDNDVSTPGLQPDPGDAVVPANGDSFGTRAGYVDWDPESIVDRSGFWSVEIGLVHSSSFAPDVSPTADAEVDVTVRRPQAFLPSAGEPVLWRLADRTTNATLQTGAAVTDGDGVVTVTGVVLGLAPARLELRRAALHPDVGTVAGSVVR